MLSVFVLSVFAVPAVFPVFGAAVPLLADSVFALFLLVPVFVLSVFEAFALGVAVGVAVGVAETVGVGVAETVGVGVGVTRISDLMPSFSISSLSSEAYLSYASIRSETDFAAATTYFP